MGAVCTAKHRKNSNLNLYNQFLFCNMFLLFVRYLHGGRHPPSELGILNFEFLLRQAAEPSGELYSFELEEELQFIGEFAAVGRALTKTFIHNPLMLFEPSAIPLWYIWSYENKFSRPYMP